MDTKCPFLSFLSNIWGPKKEGYKQKYALLFLWKTTRSITRKPNLDNFRAKCENIWFIDVHTKAKFILYWVSHTNIAFKKGDPNPRPKTKAYEIIKESGRCTQKNVFPLPWCELNNLYLLHRFHRLVRFNWKYSVTDSAARFHLSSLGSIYSSARFSPLREVYDAYLDWLLIESLTRLKTFQDEKSSDYQETYETGKQEYKTGKQIGISHRTELLRRR